MAQNKFWPGVSIDPEKDGSIQKIDGSNLEVGDGAIVITSDASYMYVLDDSGDDSNPPDVLEPTQNSESKRWKLVSMTGGSGGGADMEEPPDDGYYYGRANKEWIVIDKIPYYFYVADNDNRIYKIPGLELSHEEYVELPDAYSVNMLVISADGKKLYASDDNNKVHTIDIKGMTITETTEAFSESISNAVLASNGYIYGGEYDGLIKIDPETMEVVDSWDTCCQYDMYELDGKLVFSDDSEVHELDLEDDSISDVLYDAEDSVYRIRYYDGDMYFGLDGGDIQRVNWETKSLEETYTPSGNIYSFDIDEDGYFYAIGTENVYELEKRDAKDLSGDAIETYSNSDFKDSDGAALGCVFYYKGYVYTQVGGGDCETKMYKLDASDLSEVASDLGRDGYTYNVFEAKDYPL